MFGSSNKKDKETSSSRTKETSRGSDRERERDKDRDRERERERDRDRERERDKDSSRDKDRDRNNTITTPTTTTTSTRAGPIMTGEAASYYTSASSTGGTSLAYGYESGQSQHSSHHKQQTTTSAMPLAYQPPQPYQPPQESRQPQDSRQQKYYSSTTTTTTSSRQQARIPVSTEHVRASLRHNLIQYRLAIQGEDGKHKLSKDKDSDSEISSAYYYSSSEAQRHKEWQRERDRLGGGGGGSTSDPRLDKEGKKRVIQHMVIDDLKYLLSELQVVRERYLPGVLWGYASGLFLAVLLLLQFQRSTRVSGYVKSFLVTGYPPLKRLLRRLPSRQSHIWRWTLIPLLSFILALKGAARIFATWSVFGVLDSMLTKVQKMKKVSRKEEKVLVGWRWKEVPWRD